MTLPPLVPAVGVLSADDLARYSRQLVLPELGVTGQRRLAAARMDAEITVPEVSQSMILTRLEGGRTPMPERETVRGFAAHGATMALYLSAARNKVLQAVSYTHLTLPTNREV